MTSPRNLLLIALLFLGYLLWNAWQEDYSKAPPPAPNVAATTSSPETKAPPTASTGEVPNASSTSTAPAPSTPASTPTAATSTAAPRVVATTDVLRIEIDTRGGNVVVADLLAYPQQPKDFAHPVRIFDDSPSRYFEAQSGLVSNGGAAPDHTAPFNAEKNDYKLTDGAESIEVPLTWTDPSGVTVRKVFALKRGIEDHTRDFNLVEQ